MTVGLPGTGIGGLFYLLTAWAMPFREGYRCLRGHSDPARPTRWGLVFAMPAMATGVALGLWATGWLLGLGLAELRHLAPTSVVVARAASSGNLLGILAMFVTLGTLGGVVVGVELLRLWLYRRPKDDRPPQFGAKIWFPPPRRLVSGSRGPLITSGRVVSSVSAQQSP